tara:strand:+ start:578 stop:871 length:294 start_codon:yes stop_codon:yes gene_type:complete
MSNNKVIEDSELLKELIKRTDSLDKKLNDIISILNGDVKKNTQKMGEHIDFIERIYDNVKSPLGFLCNKINYLKGNDQKQYSLEYKNQNNDNDLDVM